MSKLTIEQINAIDKALWDIEIRFLDIRIEMTDHAATAIEGMEGNFNANLRKYISENKKELKKNYSQFRMNASIKAVKLLFRNMLSFRFVAILAFVYGLLFAEYKYEGLEGAMTKFILLSAFALPVAWLYFGYIAFTRQKKQFSTAERLLGCFGGLAFVFCFGLRSAVDKAEIEDTSKLLYYAFIISFYIMVIITYRFLTKFYKSRYQVA